MTPSLVQLERIGPVVLLRLNRPEKRNALNRALVAELGAHLGAMVADTAVRVIVLTGIGSAFCSGLDLDELNETMALANPRDATQHDSRQLAAVFRALATSPKPTIAAVNGPAVAGGAGLVTACDLAIAAPTARFGYPEVRRGILPAIVTPLLLRLVAGRAAKQLLLMGDLIEPDEAARLGIYSRVVSEEQLNDVVLEWARMIARGAPLTIAETKRWIDRASGAEELWMESADASAAGRFSVECREGLDAFREKRTPRWVPDSLAT